MLYGVRGKGASAGGVERGTSAFLDLVARLPRLHHLALDTSQFVVPLEGSYKCLQVLSKLVSLDERNHWQAPGDGSVFALAHNIRHLQIATSRIDALSLVSGSRPFPHLRHLCIALSRGSARSRKSENTLILDLWGFLSLSQYSLLSIRDEAGCHVRR